MLKHRYHVYTMPTITKQALFNLASDSEDMNQWSLSDLLSFVSPSYPMIMTETHIIQIKHLIHVKRVDASSRENLRSPQNNTSRGRHKMLSWPSERMTILLQEEKTWGNVRKPTMKKCSKSLKQSLFSPMSVVSVKKLGGSSKIIQHHFQVYRHAGQNADQSQWPYSSQWQARSNHIRYQPYVRVGISILENHEHQDKEYKSTCSLTDFEKSVVTEYARQLSILQHNHAGTCMNGS